MLAAGRCGAAFASVIRFHLTSRSVEFATRKRQASVFWEDLRVRIRVSYIAQPVSHVFSKRFDRFAHGLFAAFLDTNEKLLQALGGLSDRLDSA